jgi:hypothetical protein
MATQTFPGSMYCPSGIYLVQSGPPSFTSTTAVIDAIDEGVAAMIRIPKTGNVTKVLWATRTVTSGATITVRGETWDESAVPAIPSTTLYHANFTGTTVVANGDDNVAILTTLAGSVAVTAGDKLALIIKQPGSSAGNMQIASFQDDISVFPYLLLNTGTSPAISWAALTTAPAIALEYDDGSYGYIPGCYPMNAITATAVDNSDTPDEYGLRFKFPFPTRVNSCWVWLDGDGDFNINLYDSDGATKLLGGSFAVDKDARRADTQSVYRFSFPTTADLLADTYYRLVIEPSTTTPLNFYDFTVNTAAVMDAHEGGQNFHLTTAKDPTQDSDWTNVTTRRPFMGVGFSGFSDGVASGGGGGQRVIGG